MSHIKPSSPLKLRIQSYKEEKSGLVRAMHSEYQWRKLRNHFVKLQPVCQLCARDEKLQVHHIFPWHLRKDFRFEINNLISLCQPCHFRFGHLCDWKGYNDNLLELCEQAQRLNPTVDWEHINEFERDETVLPRWDSIAEIALM